MRSNKRLFEIKELQFGEHRFRWKLRYVSQLQNEGKMFLREKKNNYMKRRKNSYRW